MNQKRSVEQDARDLAEVIDTMRLEERKNAIESLLKRHVDVYSKKILLTHEDFQVILSSAVESYVNGNYQREIVDSKGRKVKITNEQTSNFCLINSVISFLNGRDAFIKLAYFDDGLKNPNEVMKKE